MNNRIRHWLSQTAKLWTRTKSSKQSKPKESNTKRVFRRSALVYIRDMRHVVMLALACLFLFFIITANLVVPYWGRIKGASAILRTVLIMFYLVPSMWVSTKFYFTYRDLHDERYEITNDGWLVTIYQTWGEYHEPRKHKVSDIVGGKFVRSGKWQYFLNYGDVILYGRWYGDPFVLRDVYKPARVYALIMHAKRGHFDYKDTESALSQTNS